MHIDIYYQLAVNGCCLLTAYICPAPPFSLSLDESFVLSGSAKIHQLSYFDNLFDHIQRASH